MRQSRQSRRIGPLGMGIQVDLSHVEVKGPGLAISLAASEL